ncbi:MAG: hypothetical protein NC409_04545 [Clostridium sp.]|nr:hypothetical protein [Clostridium sp.]
MAIDIETIRLHQRELNKVSDEIAFAGRKLKGYQSALDEAWKSAEIRGMDFAIEDITRQLNRITRALEDLGHDVIVTGEELEREAAELDSMA